MNPERQRERLRALLSGTDCAYPASVFDPASARSAESLGFEACMLAGSVASLAILGAPDKILITLSELASLAGRIAQATALPLLVDADHGYGTALNVARTVAELEMAGVSGLTIEDTMLPTPYGTSGKGALISRAEGIGKMRAAVAARGGPGLVVVGRTSGLAIAGLDEAIERIQAYEGAGVDAIFVTGIRDKPEVAALSAAATVPLILGQTPADVMADRQFLAAHRVRLCLQGHAPIAAAIQAAHDALAGLRTGTAPDALPGVAPRTLMDLISRAHEYEAAESEYLGVNRDA